MSSNVSPEEVEALLDDELSSGARPVAVRDFRLPCRLGRAQQLSIRAAVAQRVLDIEHELQNWLRAPYPMELVDIGETTSVGLFEHLEDPIVVLTVKIDGVPGWIVWESGAALAAAAVAMGGDPPEEDKEEEDRVLTPLEAGIVGDILRTVSDQICDSLDLEVETGSMSLNVRTFLANLEPAGDTDPQRLFLHLCIDGPGGESIVRFYLPGLLPDKPVGGAGRAAVLPGHLDDVPVEISAHLGSLEVSLQDLMGVEVGDVIPLSLPVGESLEILVEGEPAGKASWGNFQGRLAVRLDRLNTERENKPS